MGSTMTTPTACPTPPSIANANVSVIYDVASYRCNDGYIMRGNPNNMTCVLGQWKGFPPNCIDGASLDEEPNSLWEDMPLWLALTLAAVGVTAAAVITCCCVALCCLGKKRNKGMEDIEDMVVDGPGGGSSNNRSNRVHPANSDDKANKHKEKSV